MRLLAFLILVLCGSFLLPPSQVQAQRIYCPLPEDGTWINSEAKPKQISRVEVQSRCENEQVFVRARAFTSCIPRDCKWGWTQGELRSDGAIMVLLTGFFSSKQLTMKAFGDVLDVKVTDITNDASQPVEDEVYNLQRK